MSNGSSHNWADLPLEILELIGNRLETRIELYRFRAICTSWRSVLPLSTNNISSIVRPLKLKMMDPTYSPSLAVTAFLSPVFFCLLQDQTRTASCFIKVIPLSSEKLKIMDPLSLSRRISTHSSFYIDPVASTKSINILSLRVVQVSKGYRVIYRHIPADDTAFKKVVLFGECGIFTMNELGQQLGFFRFNDQKWTKLESEGRKYDDIVIYKGQCYVVDTLGTVYWINAKSMSLVQFSPTLFGPGQVKNLLVSDGELFVVDSYYDDGQLSQRRVDDLDRVDIRIFRLDEEWGKWVNVKSLGDRVFVLANEGCFSVSTQDIPGCNRNCVYFSEARKQGRVFDIEDGRRMKTIDRFPSHRKLFDLSMNFPCTLAPPEFPVSLGQDGCTKTIKPLPY